MLVEIMGGPHDGVVIEIADSTRPPSDAFDPAKAAAYFAGVPVHKDELRGTLYILWVDLEVRADALRSIGPAIDRVLLLMHEREFKDDK